jgi:predicted RNase H-like HicB family nuclease
METLSLTIDCWEDDGWYVGQLRELPNVLSQGKTLEELKENILDAYELMVKDSVKRRRSNHAHVRSIPLCIPA